MQKKNFYFFFIGLHSAERSRDADLTGDIFPSQIKLRIATHPSSDVNVFTSTQMFLVSFINLELPNPSWLLRPYNTLERLTAMKVIITGATGFIGGEVLGQCIINPSITNIVVLSRRDISATAKESNKVEVIIHENFLEYPDSLLERLGGASACIWSAPLHIWHTPVFSCVQ
jgi:hypothetical protein